MRSARPCVVQRVEDGARLRVELLDHVAAAAQRGSAAEPRVRHARHVDVVGGEVEEERLVPVRGDPARGLPSVGAARRDHDDGAPLHFQPRSSAVSATKASASCSEARPETATTGGASRGRGLPGAGRRRSALQHLAQDGALRASPPSRLALDAAVEVGRHAEGQDRGTLSGHGHLLLHYSIHPARSRRDVE